MKGKTVLAIIGYGYMGKIYHTACRELIQQKKRETNYKAGVNRLLDKLSLKAIVDPLVKIGYRGGIWYFNDIGHMLARRIEMGINAAIIATPIPTHYDIARQCINAYLHLLIEKPVCPSFSQVRSLSRLSRAKGVKILPGHVERYNPVTVEAREALKYRMWGKPVQYNLIRVSPRPERVKESLIIDKLIHDLDLVEYLFGSYRIKKVSLVKKKKEIMQCRLTTLHPDGLHGEIFSSWTSPVKERKVFIKFSRGSLEGDLINKNIMIHRDREFSKQILAARNNQIRDQLVDFVAFVNHSPIKPLVSLQDALRSAFHIDEIEKKLNKNNFRS